MRRQLIILATLSLAIPAAFDAAAQSRIRNNRPQTQAPRSEPAAAKEEPSGGQGEFVPVTDAMLKDPAPGDWLMWRRTLNGWGYSPLTQIDKGNVKNLSLIHI